MQNVLAAAKKVLAAVVPVLALLKKPGVATAVVGYATPVILGIAGDNFNAAVLVPYVLAVGGAAAGLQKLLAKSAPAPIPAPPPAPAKAKVSKLGEMPKDFPVAERKPRPVRQSPMVGELKGKGARKASGK